MGSDILDDHVVYEDSTEDAVDDSHSNKRNQGKVPKRVLKAERERLKREQLNELFEKLAWVLETNQENNGKASVLNETIKHLKDMVSHIQSLRKENATLLSESHYMTKEKDELKEENAALEMQIKKMQNEVEERLSRSKPDLNISPSHECWFAETPSHFMEGHLQQIAKPDPSSQQRPVLSPLYVIPIDRDLQAFKKIGAVSGPPITVSKPHARYPTPADSWPLQLLSRQSETTIGETSS